MSRQALVTLHRVAGIAGCLTILTFWTTTLGSELFGSHATVAAVKHAVLWGMLLLVPAMIAVGATGFRLGGQSVAPVIVAKRRRMPVIAANGLVVLLPSSVFLASRAAAGTFDGVFYAVQAVELTAGAVNLLLMGLSVRDGLGMRRKARAG